MFLEEQKRLKNYSTHLNRTLEVKKKKKKGRTGEKKHQKLITILKEGKQSMFLQITPKFIQILASQLGSEKIPFGVGKYCVKRKRHNCTLY